LKTFTQFTLAFASAILAVGTATAGPVNIPAKLPGIPLDESPVYNPAGNDEAYMMSVTEDQGPLGVSQQDGYKMTIRRDDDGETIWFRDLTPGFSRHNDDDEYTWIKGTVSGTDITVKAGQVIYQNDFYGQKLYLESVTVDNWGSVDKFLDEIHFTIEGDRIVQTDNTVYLAVYKDGETIDEAGFFIFMNNFVIEPVGEIDKITPPANVETEDWIMTWNGGSRSIKVARDAETYYVAGLAASAPEDYVSGTVSGNTVTFKSGYILTSNPTRYIRLIGAAPGQPDEWGFPTLEMIMSYTFDIADDGKTLTLNPADNYIVEASYNFSSFYNGFSAVKLFPYSGDKPAVPAAPEVDYDELNDLLTVTFPSADINGDYINPDRLTYRVEFDGVPYEFSPDSYFGLSEPMIEIPYSFTDYYDIYVNGPLHTIFLHDTPRWNTVEAVTTYTVDGISNSSSSASQSGIGDITVENKQIVAETYTDLTGRRITSPSPGSIVIVSTRYDDGTVVNSKRIIR